MKHQFFYFAIFLLFWKTEAQTSDQWYKGNTHTHSYWSDGNAFPEMIMEWYKSNGYDFISLSDHNILAENGKWKKIPNKPLAQNNFKEYLEKYGEDWVNHKKDSAGNILVKLKTFAEYKPLFEEKGEFLILPAEEISDRYKNKPIHIGAVNIEKVIAPQGGHSVLEVMQNNLNAVYDQRKKSGTLMFAHINHPNFKSAITVDDMLKLKGDRFFEVFNGHPAVHNYGGKSMVRMDELWDLLLINCIKNGKPLIYGIATDDSHDYLKEGNAYSNPGRGWIMVKSEKLTAGSLIQAMENGNFYASTGVELSELNFLNNQMIIKIKAEKNVEYKVQFWGAKISDFRNGGQRILLKEIQGDYATYTLGENDLYVRAKIISTKIKENPYKVGDFETAWVQPVVQNKN